MLLYNSPSKHKKSLIEQLMSYCKPTYVACLVLSVGSLVTLLNVLQLRQMQQEHFDVSHGSSAPEGDPNANHKQHPIYWVEAKNSDGGYLDHVFRVLNRLGFVRGNKDSNWDLLWHHDYPFMKDSLKPMLKNLEAHQKVNHIPGSGYYTSKVNLAVSNITGIPPAFSLPNDQQKFLSHARQHPEKLWVQKSNKHRGVKILTLDQLDLSAENSFIQEFVAKPLLIDGHKFDIGVYTVVTSTLPLRVYILEQDSLLRFCPHKYEPFDAADVDKYVVGDDYKPTWLMPSLKTFYETNKMTHRECLNAHLRSRGKDPRKLWTAIAHTIRQVFLSKAKLIQPLIHNYKHTQSFFELSRFDFVVDENLNVYLMEANMSPNLSSAHFSQNKLLYEQVLFNMFALVGVANHLTLTAQTAVDAEQMQVCERDIQLDYCATDCKTCTHMRCQLCAQCANNEVKQMLIHAHKEHLNRHGMRRVLPAPLDARTVPAVAQYEQYLAAALPPNTVQHDLLMHWWFHAKCVQDTYWCN